MIAAHFDGTFAGWRDRARALLDASVPADAIAWLPAGEAAPLLPGLAAEAPGAPASERAPGPRVPRSFLDRAARVACHRDPARWALLYRLLQRVARRGAAVLDDPADPDVAAFDAMERGVSHDVHRMKAFVRFHPVADAAAPGGARMVAFHRPEHRVLPLVAPFFAARFNASWWSILTPAASVHWDGRALSDGPGTTTAPDGSDADAAVEALWRTYYASTFNPARVNPAALLRHVPRKHWETMPEMALAPGLIRGAAERTRHMLAQEAASAEPFVPRGAALGALRVAAAACRGCPLGACATQTVFGEGAGSARLVLVGEQPGDEEDRHGRPFVGPAGAVLDRALAAAGVDRAALYVTNAVKHFKFVERGKRRIHQKPAATEVRACRPWLEEELARVRPQVIVALGGTAALSLFGGAVRPMRDRGRPLASPLAPHAFVTYHPAAVLRAGAPAAAAAIEAALQADLRLAAAALAAAGAPASGGGIVGR